MIKPPNSSLNNNNKNPAFLYISKHYNPNLNKSSIKTNKNRSFSKGPIIINNENNICLTPEQKEKINKIIFPLTEEIKTKNSYYFHPSIEKSKKSIHYPNIIAKHSKNKSLIIGKKSVKNNESYNKNDIVINVLIVNLLKKV